MYKQRNGSDHVRNLSVLVMVFVLVTVPVGTTMGYESVYAPATPPSEGIDHVAGATQQEQQLTKCKEIDSSGTYVLSGSINADEYDRLPCVKVTASNVVIKGSGTLSNGGISVGGSNAKSISSVTIKNINFDQGGVWFADVTDATVTETTITSSSSKTIGVSFAEVSDGEITNNQIIGTSDTPPLGIKIRARNDTGGSSNILIQNNEITGTEEGIFFWSDGQDDPIRSVTVRDNTITDSTHHGIHVNSFNSQFSEGTYIEDLSITDNTIRSNDGGEGTDASGIAVSGTTVGLSITNNDVSANTGNGIHIGGHNRNARITNNRAIDNGVDGIFFNGTNALVKENNASRNEADGFRIRGHDVIVTDNVAHDNIETESDGSRVGEDGIAIFGTEHRVANNIVHNNTNGISLSGRQTDLESNLVTDSINRGIQISGENHTIVSNTVTNSTAPRNFGGGINLLDRANNNLLRDNTVRNNTWSLILHLEKLDHPGQVTNTIDRLHLRSAEYPADAGSRGSRGVRPESHQQTFIR